MYWEAHTRYPNIADVMPRNQFDTLLRYLHFNDNANMKPRDHPECDKLFKIKPLVTHLQQKFKELKPEEYNSVDEQIIPYKGKHSMKQYIKNKPHKWGYKVFSRAGASGIVYSFELYQGKQTEIGSNPEGLGISGSIVTHLCTPLVGTGAKIFFDNWFTSPDLISALKSRGLNSVGTVRKTRINGCPLKSEKELKVKGRGAVDSAVEKERNIVAVKWLDNKEVTLLSSYAAIEPLDEVKRFDSKEKKHVAIPRPAIVREYNKFMGGVDLCDMLLELYRIDIPMKKWYFRILFYCIDLTVCNCWLISRYYSTYFCFN